MNKDLDELFGKEITITENVQYTGNVTDDPVNDPNFVTYVVALSVIYRHNHSTNPSKQDVETWEQVLEKVRAKIKTIDYLRGKL